AEKINCFEFEKLEKSSAGTRFFLKNGQSVMITEYQNRGVVLYPNYSKTPLAELSTALASYENHATKSPATRQFLNPVIVKLRGIVAANSNQPKQAADTATITLADGTVLKGCKLSRIEGETVSLIHEDGIKKVQITMLSDQTRTLLKIDMAAIERAKVAKPDTVDTGPPKAATQDRTAQRPQENDHISSEPSTAEDHASVTGRSQENNQMSSGPSVVEDRAPVTSRPKENDQMSSEPSVVEDRAPVTSADEAHKSLVGSLVNDAQVMGEIYGGGDEGKNRAGKEMAEAMAAVALGLAPNVEAEVTMRDHIFLCGYAAKEVQRLAWAAGLAAGANVALAADTGYQMKMRTQQEITHQRGDAIGKIMSEERGALVMEYILQRSIHYTRDLSRVMVLRAKLVDASNQDALRDARSAIYSFIEESTGVSAGSYLANNGGMYEIMENFSASSAESFVQTIAGISEGRIQRLLKAGYSKDESLQHNFKFSSDEAGLLGPVIANFNAKSRRELGEILASDAGAKEAAIATYLKNNESASYVLETLKIDTSDWVKLLASKVTKPIFHQLGSVHHLFFKVKHFVAIADQRDLADERLAAFVRMNSTKK
ncbi:hypothetical protein HQ447_08275, partial [bacterium]|nr:hypothetical protein [bacterium]